MAAMRTENTAICEEVFALRRKSAGTPPISSMSQVQAGPTEIPPEQSIVLIDTLDTVRITLLLTNTVNLKPVPSFDKAVPKNLPVSQLGELDKSRFIELRNISAAYRPAPRKAK